VTSSPATDSRSAENDAAGIVGPVEGSFGFPIGGDPDDLMRGLREFAERQAESVAEGKHDAVGARRRHGSHRQVVPLRELRAQQPSGELDVDDDLVGVQRCSTHERPYQHGCAPWSSGLPSGARA